MPPPLPLASVAVALVASSAIAPVHAPGTAPESGAATEPVPGGKDAGHLRSRRLQGAQMVGGAPPKAVEMALCDIGTVFAKLNEIKSNPDCHSQPAPPTWYPGRADTCNAACGIVFEPFWDQCGEMLTVAGMGGMDEMGIFCAFANIRRPDS